MTTAIVGCGFLGSLFGEELAKRMMAFEQGGLVRCIDFDTFDARNAANQNCRLIHTDMPKAECLAQIVSEYGLQSQHLNIRLTQENVHALLGDATLIVDAVDHLPTRHILWRYGKGKGIPVLHLGISRAGTGSVDWSAGVFDSWALNPIALILSGAALQENAQPEDEEPLPPCELVRFRALGLLTALSGAQAWGIFRGMDPEQAVGVDGESGTLTVWQTTNDSRVLIESYTPPRVEQVDAVEEGDLPALGEADADL